MKKLYIYFPQWQGSGETNELYKGASVLKHALENEYAFIDIPQPDEEVLVSEQSILGYKRLEENLRKMNELLKQQNPDSVFVVGGDCSIDVGPISYLNKHYASDLMVLWIDAHGDLNTPESSPSKTFHGMPLRLLLGEGNAHLLNLRFSSLTSQQVLLVGAREFDTPEQAYIQKTNLAVISPKDTHKQSLSSQIKASQKSNLYIHLDVDVFDPQEFPDSKHPTVDGVSLLQIKELIMYLKKNYSVVGGSIAEYAPKGDSIDTPLSEIARELFV